MDTGIDQRHFYSAVKIAARYKLSGDQASVTNGTGFVVECKDLENRYAIVSNRHILDKAWLEPLYSGAELQLDIDFWADRETKLTCKILPSNVFAHRDDSVDVAAVAFDRVYMREPVEGMIVLKSGIPWDFLVEAQNLWHLLEPAETVFLPGYPQWYDRNGGRPIMRTGAIVSDPQLDYRRHDHPPNTRDGNRQILFEAFSSDGNSGSPVFVAQRGIKSSDHIEFTGVYHRSFMVGINAGHMQIQGDAIEDSKGSIHLTNWHVGLSRMFKTSAIIDVVEDLSAQYQWTTSTFPKQPQA